MVINTCFGLRQIFYQITTNRPYLCGNIKIWIWRSLNRLAILVSFWFIPVKWLIVYFTQSGLSEADWEVNRIETQDCHDFWRPETVVVDIISRVDRVFPSVWNFESISCKKTLKAIPRILFVSDLRSAVTVFIRINGNRISAMWFEFHVPTCRSPAFLFFHNNFNIT